MQIRRAVRPTLAALGGVGKDDALALVGLSGGADSLALAAAVAAEAGQAGVRAGAVIVDHALQSGSKRVADSAAAQARGLGLAPVVIRRVEVAAAGGPEAAARDARYGAFVTVAAELGAAAVLTAHTRDDQAEQVLLALARGSGTRSVAGIPSSRPLSDGVDLLRPLLGETWKITRATTEAACAELGLTPWNDPHNLDASYARVRVRETALPTLARELGPGVVAGLARSADLAREDADALDDWAGRVVAALLPTVRPLPEGGEAAQRRAAEGPAHPGPAPERQVIDAGGVSVLEGLPAAVRQRAIHQMAREYFGAALTREHTLSIAALITHWKGQGPVFVPGIRVTRVAGELVCDPQNGSPRDTHSMLAES
ncbi:tRNA lysidine(34) synthetase TilS [Leucobacter aridicollis]|uniref:tRNA lysidine(34) synthetase TilS n=1 Tax=Leucobacter aridicollis TaxID=283878 RepID=UPI000E65E9C2|nr:tRNA lysidine(34) synthetase TilS [Leucobacter aridicollis]